MSPNSDDAIERRIAEVLTRDRSSGLCPLDGPCTSCDCFDPLHEYDRANAKAVMAEVVTPELGRLRNRITALEANGSELLAERDALRAAIAEAVRQVREWMTPGASLFDPGHATEVETLLKKTIGERTIAALDAPEIPRDAGALYERK